jgi:4-hydroxybenzoate polyprenyltransferase
LSIAMSALYCAGMSLNDICDRDADAVSQPFRPIASGRVELSQARWVTGLLFGLGLGLLLLTPFSSAIFAGLLLVGLIALYDRFHKAHPASVFLMAGCRLMVFVVSGWAAAGAIAPMLMVGAGICFLYTVLISVVARHENTRAARHSFPLIPRLIAGMPLVDAAFVSIVVAPSWILPGIVAALLTLLGQRYVRGD